MNVKAGDLAVIVSDHSSHPETAGALCDVLYAATFGECVLPDGVPSYYSRHTPGWVIKFHSPIRIRWWDGIFRQCSYACCPDEKLRPIRDPGEDATDEMVLRVGKPVANPEGVPA